MPLAPLVSPQDRDAIAQLQLFVRAVMEGVAGGQHRSPHKGSSAEFKEHRQYVRGDETRSIDWKLFGKTDRLFIRQYEEETNLRATLLLDQSGSMAYGQERPNSISKHGFSVRLAACLATLLIAQQDAVGLATFDTRLQDTLSARSRPGHLQAIFKTLVKSRPGQETSLGSVLRQTAPLLTRRGLLILISDCFDALDPMASALRFFRRAGHELVVFQIWHPDELEFPFRSRTQFRSLEGGQDHHVDPLALRQTYLERVSRFRQELENLTAKERITLIPCTTAQQHTDVLTQFMARRHHYRGSQQENQGSPKEDPR